MARDGLAPESTWTPSPAFGRLNRLGFRALRAFAFLTLRPYFRLRLEGAEHLPRDGAFLVAPNHCSYLDPVVLQAALPRRRLVFMMTREWYDKPVLGAFFRFMRCIPVEGHGRNRDALDRCVAALRSGLPVGIFPEGRIHPEGALGRFHSGVAALALRAGVPIVPAAIVGSGRAFPKGRWLPRPHRVVVRLGPVIDPAAPAGSPGDAVDRRARWDAMVGEVRAAVEVLLAESRGAAT